MKGKRINAFRTLKGFLEGQEDDEEIYFKYSATLRISGENIDLDQLTKLFGVTPTLSYKKGESKGGKIWTRDMWQYTSKVDEYQGFDEHLSDLWTIFKGKIDFLRELKQTCSVDIFLGYRSNCDHAGFEFQNESLRLFNALEIPFGVSVILG